MQTPLPCRRPLKGEAGLFAGCLCFGLALLVRLALIVRLAFRRFSLPDVGKRSKQLIRDPACRIVDVVPRTVWVDIRPLVCSVEEFLDLLRLISLFGVFLEVPGKHLADFAPRLIEWNAVIFEVQLAHERAAVVVVSVICYLRFPLLFLRQREPSPAEVSARIICRIIHGIVSR